MMIEENVLIRKDVKIGKDPIIKCGAILGTGVTIGDECYIGPQAILLHMQPNGSSSPCVIGDHVFIGANATICPSVYIESGSIIGAGAVVTKSIVVPGTYAGNPAKRISEETYNGQDG